jgi:hypothetical protein
MKSSQHNLLLAASANLLALYIQMFWEINFYSCGVGSFAIASIVVGNKRGCDGC